MRSAAPWVVKRTAADPVDRDRPERIPIGWPPERDDKKRHEEGRPLKIEEPLRRRTEEVGSY